MGKDLVIVESPAKARTLGRVLGGAYNIRASMGHVRDLPQRNLGVRIENGFEPEYEPSESRKKVIGELRQLARGAGSIYLATDPDREGEAIAWHLRELLQRGKDDDFQRVTFHELTPGAIRAAFAQPHRLDMDRVNAQQARRILDRIVGYKVSPLLWKRIETGTSAGRVQSVALRLICEREREVQDFQPEEYWLLTALFDKVATHEQFRARLALVDGEKADVHSADHANALADDAQQLDYRVVDVQKQPRQRRPSPPFITSTLQQAASANLRFSPEQTMRLAQDLYEGVDTGNGPVGLITYMRTDSVNVAKDAQEAARSFIARQWGDDYVPAKPNYYRSGKGAQEAHEAIRPTDVNLTPEAAARFLESRHARLYRLIWNRFMASQMAAARELRYTVELSNRWQAGPDVPPPARPGDHAYTFRATSTVVTFPGFLSVYNLHDVEEEGEDAEERVPELKALEPCDLTALDRDQKFTEPPPRFTEATLVRELERNGVGRPSTYAATLNVLRQRKYVRTEKRKLLPTDLGSRVNAFLVGRLPQLFDVGFTARMESQLDEVETGRVQWQQMLADFYGHFQTWLEQARTRGVPPIDELKELLGLFPDDLTWRPPEQLGRRKIDDREFYQSFRDRVEAGRKLSDRQWQAFLRMLVTYADRLPGLAPVVDRLELAGDLDDARQEIAQAAEAHQGEPEESTRQMIAALVHVNDWQKDTRGGRTYDDRKFYRSLAAQVDGGRPLSDKQKQALARLLRKYSRQIPDFEKFAAEADLPAVATPSLDEDQFRRLFALADAVGKWEPPSGKGRRRFDAEGFVKSLREQYDQRGTLSERQIGALKRVLARHADQIPEFSDRSAGLDLPDADGKTGVACPECGRGELQRKRFRRRTFFGCSRYPECKFTVNKLEDAAKGNEETAE